MPLPDVCGIKQVRIFMVVDFTGAIWPQESQVTPVPALKADTINRLLRARKLLVNASTRILMA
jgi:hypothetical protein